MTHVQWRSYATMALLGSQLLGTACSAPVQDARHDEELSAEDSAAVARADRAYAAGWLAGGADPVMTTLHRDAVIIPSGMDPLNGVDEIRGWWFPPDAPPTNVHRYELDQSEVGGSGTLAFVHGSFELAFEYDGSEHESGGTYLTLLRPDDEGNWLISHRMWSDR